MATRTPLLVMLALATLGLLPARAHAAPKPGFYAASCNQMRWGATKAAALRACDRAVRADKDLDARACNCTKHATVVELTADTKPAFFLAGYNIKGRDPRHATLACEHARKLYVAKHPRDRDTDWECKTRIIAVYGPFERRPESVEEDGDLAYNYLTTDGQWVDETGEGPCFVAGTAVMTPDGPKAIETFEVGDPILSWSPSEGREVVAHVVRVKPRLASELLTLVLGDGRTLTLTPNHPLWVAAKGAWIPAGQLAVGDALSVLEGDQLAPMAVVSITRTQPAPGTASADAGDVPVYDLTVETTHSYFAAGVWSHNY
ncbi:MAG: Hint domain-containing protein [Myxococcota bacterium]